MKIYSATQFYNELDILFLRLKTLDSVVDYHIITESNLSHSGIPKPFYYEENKERFKEFWPKIIYQKLDHLPEDYVNLSPDSAKSELERICIEKVIAGKHWPHEHSGYGRDTYEKESVLMCMGNCQPEDLIISTDLDEIPNPKVIKFIQSRFDPNMLYNLKMRTFFYYLNCEKEDNWIGGFVTSFENFKKTSVSDMRVHRRGMFIEKSGWHFSYQNGLDKIKEKIEAINEYELNNPIIKNNLKSNVENCLTNNRDLYFRPTKFWITPIDETFPEYLQIHQEEFAHMIYKP